MTAEQLKIKEKYPDWNTFLEKQGAKNLIVNYHSLTTIHDIVKIRRFTLSDLQEIYPFKDTYAGVLYFKNWIDFFNEYSNISRQIPQKQIPTLTFQLYGKYKHFTLPDMRLILDRILETYYEKTKFFGSIDTQSLLTAFYYYNEERKSMVTKLTEERESILKAKKAELWDQIKQEEYSKILADKNFKGNDPFREAERRAEKRLIEIVENIAI